MSVCEKFEREIFVQRTFESSNGARLVESTKVSTAGESLHSSHENSSSLTPSVR